MRNVLSLLIVSAIDTTYMMNIRNKLAIVVAEAATIGVTYVFAVMPGSIKPAFAQKIQPREKQFMRPTSFC
jgi:uncharacterized protein involved in response to NO